MIFLAFFCAFLGLTLFKGLHIVPHQNAWVVQRLGRFSRILEPGLNWIVPFIDSVAYRHSLKEDALEVPEQMAITQDNVSVLLDGMVYVKIVDAFAASYGIKDPIFAVTQLVQTSMRSEMGKIPLDKAFEERESLNRNIVEAINEASASWGVLCMRYEIKDIKIPEEIRKSMELQMTAERQKRARILESEGLRQAQINESEGERQAQINIAEGMKGRTVLESEAGQIDKINRARGEAEAIALLAEATSASLTKMADALRLPYGDEAARLKVTERYLEAFHALAKEGTTMLLPSDMQHPANAVAQAFAIYDQVKKKAPAALSH